MKFMLVVGSSLLSASLLGVNPSLIWHSGAAEAKQLHIHVEVPSDVVTPVIKARSVVVTTIASAGADPFVVVESEFLKDVYKRQGFGCA